MRGESSQHFSESSRTSGSKSMTTRFKEMSIKKKGEYGMNIRPRRKWGGK